MLGRRLEALPKVYGAEAERLKDDYVSTEHLLPAMADSGAKRWLAAQGLDRDSSGAPARSDCALQARTSV